MRRLACFGLMLALMSAGCDSESSNPDAGGGGTDAGPRVDSGGGGTDAGGGGTDAGGGGTDAGGGGTDAGGGGTDAGGTPTDAGPTPGDCPVAPLTIQATCPAFAACGGEVEGTWCYEGICIEEGIFSNPTLDAVCPTRVFSDVVGTVAGFVEFTATTVERDVQTQGSATLTFSGTNFCSAACDDIEAGITAALAPDGSANCELPLPTGPCICAIEFASRYTTDTTDTTYTIDATDDEITVGAGGTARTYEYCNDSSGFRFEDTTASGAEPGVQSLEPQAAP